MGDMVKNVSLDPLSYTSIPIKMRTVTDEVIACATAFFYRHGDKTYLITNWHNVTGLHPKTKERIDLTSPVALSLALVHASENAISWSWGNLNLYDSGNRPEWFVHPVHRENVDVVALEVELDGDVGQVKGFKCVNDIEFDDINPRVADDVFILGFPNNLSSGGRFPLWKKGSIASEPDIDVGDAPKFYVDAATRKGMSGSPVIIRRIGVHNVQDGIFNDDSSIGEAQVFGGVYSGRIQADDLLAAQIGIVWKPSVIEEIIEGRQRERLYYPEASFPSVISE